jgi:hypothetical protein
MPSPTERAIDIAAARARLQRGDRFGEKDRLMT